MIDHTKGWLHVAALAVHRFRDDENAASAVEYAILASLIAAVIATTVLTLGQKTSGTIGSVVSGLK